MANKKKLTMKEVEERINVLAYNINQVKAMIDNIGFALSRYIDYKGDASEFKKHLENNENVDKFKESKQNDLKNDGK